MRGLTFIELLVGLAIIGIFLACVAPIGWNFISPNAVWVHVDEMVQAVKEGETEARALGENIVLAPLCETGTACIQDWSKGMQLFVDRDFDNQYTAIDTLLQVWPWYSKEIEVTWKGWYTDDYLTFSNNSIAHGALSGSFTVCPQNTKDARGKKVILNRLGRVRFETYACNS